MGRRTKQSSSSSSSFWYSSRSRSSSAPATPRPESAEPPLGCMSMVHYLIFAPGAGCVGRPPTSSCNNVVTPHDGHGLARGDATSSHGRDDSGGKSGFEAPRNSLDLDADNPNDIQIGVQIQPVFDALASRTTSMRRSTKPTAPSSEAETPRTPSLVARLMGIDGLPDQQPSPSPAHHKKPGSTGRRSTGAGVGKENNCCSPPASKEKKKRVIPESMNRREPLRSLSCNSAAAAGEACRSLPDTPRASTSARASWDGARLSLQALKENVLDRAAHYMSMPSSPTSLSSAASGKKKKDGASSRRRWDDKAAAAKEHAREILRQAKETVASRKSGSGKNTASSSPAAEKRQMSCFNNKENVVMTCSPAAPPPAMEYPTKQLRVVVQVQQTPKPPTVAVVPKPSAAEHQHSPRLALAPRQQQQPSPPPPPQRAKPSRPPPPPPPLDPSRTRARKPDGCERFATRIKKPAACPASAPPATSSCPASTTTDNCCSASAAAVAHARVPSSSPLEEDPEYGYLRAVLERGGFMRPSPPPRRPPWRGHSAASPVDPIVFHLLELELPAEESRLGPLRHRWNRKLLFHLAQELLADLLLGLDSASSSSTATMTMTMPTGLPLLGKVWRKVRSFPALDCRVVGDIDALVEADLEERRSSLVVRRLPRHPAVVEEAGDVAEEVADRVLDALVAECVAESVSVSFAAQSSSSSRAAAAR